MPRFGNISPRPASIRYVEGAAPFGAPELVRPARGSSVTLNPTLEMATARLIAKAWSDSDWLKGKLSPPDTARFKADGWKSRVAEQAYGGPWDSMNDPGRQAAWFAIRPTEGNRRGKPGEFAIPGDVVG